MNASFFTSLDRIVQSEPWLPRDRAMIDMLRSLGIEKGKPFNPEAKPRHCSMRQRARRRLGSKSRYDTGLPTFYEGGRWTVPAVPELLAGVQADFNDPDKYPVDARGFTYTFAFVGIKRLGTGQFYLVSLRDKDGIPFDGGKTYRLTVPREFAGRTVLVGDGLRPRDARAHPQHAASEPLLADRRDAEERRRLGGSSTSARRRRRAKRRTGCRPTPSVASNSCSAPTRQPRRFSRRSGGCRMLKR